MSADNGMDTAIVEHPVKDVESLPITLADWINQVGSGRLAKRLGTTETAVLHWRRGHCLPRVPYMVRIHRLSKGRVTYAEMIETYYRKARRKLRAAASK